MLLFSACQREKEFSPLLDALNKEKKPVLVAGISSALRELFPGAVLYASGKKALILVPGEEEAASLSRALSTVFPKTLFFPPRDFSLVRMDCAGSDFSRQRLRVLSAILQGDFQCVVTTVEAACQATVPPEKLTSLRQSFAVGDPLEKEALLRLANEAGYETTHRVEGPGQVASRGDIVDLFFPNEDYPIRVEFFGDEIDAIGYFDSISQRRLENLTEFTLSPAEELPFTPSEKETVALWLQEALEKSAPEEKEKRVMIRELRDRLTGGMDFARDLFLPLVYRFATLLDYFDDELIFLHGQSEAQETLRRLHGLLHEELVALAEENKTLLPPEEFRLLADFPSLCQTLQQRRVLLMENFFAGKSAIAPAGIFSFRTRAATVSFRDMAGLGDEAHRLLQDGYTPLLLCENSMAAENLARFLEDRGLPFAKVSGEEPLSETGKILLLSRSAPGAQLVQGGFELGDGRIALLSDPGPETAKRKKRSPSPVKESAKKKILSYADLAPGDYVVHTGHGIGIFQGVEKMKSADGTRKDFIKIAYAGTDVLYVPCSNLDSVSKYIGPKSDSATLKLNRLGGTEWQKMKLRARKSARDIAKQLIALYAARQRSKGHAFSPDTTWQEEFENAFPYGETEGQLRATREIKEDMEKPVPMDRLLCGDVGFGKTEVALRGVFKCVMDNKQAAILVPTTILAWQHYQTVLARFRGYPVRVEMLSRFRSKKEQAAILTRLKNGEIDILVGTHRLLQKDVVFSDLGFLVIDEEQRFGVTHKERLKELSFGVDVLTLTATPIPRTMNMALGGIKDMSLLEEAPEDRFPVQTYVLEYDRGLLLEAIRREFRRGGQVFYLNNNIEELERLLPALQREFPEAGIALAHGKMDKDGLSDIWKAMMDRELDLLLCTTIIETGVDLPDANTLIVENADHFGLSQLHQIRGRVGRSDRRAYAYLTYRRGKMLSELSVKRLEAIREYTRFGSGFQIALRDLEIRGAGNLLGAEQSGHLDSVGYDMYMRILNEAVLEEKGETLPPPPVECTVDLALDGYIPESYVPYPAERMDLYRKIACLKTREDVEDMTDELLDRFGTPPRSVQGLFTVALLRARAEAAGCEKIRQHEGNVTFTFPALSADVAVLMGAVYASRLSISYGTKLRFTLRLKEKESPADQCAEFFTHLTGFTQEVSLTQLRKETLS